MHLGDCSFSAETVPPVCGGLLYVEGTVQLLQSEIK
jgi:hypothetical protein